VRAQHRLRLVKVFVVGCGSGGARRQSSSCGGGGFVRPARREAAPQLAAHALAAQRVQLLSPLRESGGVSGCRLRSVGFISRLVNIPRLVALQAQSLVYVAEEEANQRARSLRSSERARRELKALGGERAVLRASSLSLSLPLDMAAVTEQVGRAGSALERECACGRSRSVEV
jgi:hypothetical protein